jgi:hypothetical protein
MLGKMTLHDLLGTEYEVKVIAGSLAEEVEKN